MQQFIAKFSDQIVGTLSGFDRLVLRGSIRRLTHPDGMRMYLIRNQLLCKQYLDHVRQVSQSLKEASLEPFRRQHLPVQHIRDPKLDKDAMGRALAAQYQIREGQVCAFTAMELTPTFEHRATSMAVRYRPTLVVYHYQIDPEWGWMHARIQTWFPFYIHICINGREWLSRQMDRAGLKYVRHDNCFPWIEDLAQAQTLFDQQLHNDWNHSAQAFADRLNPVHRDIFRNFDAVYYWTGLQCEWATDMMFRPGTLERLEPLLLRHGMLNFSSPDVMRFWGKRLRLDGSVPEKFDEEIITSWKRRTSGERLKHWMQGNSLKAYGKAHTPVGDIFRTELMTAHTGIFRNFRPSEAKPEDPPIWRQMRKGVVDLADRAKLSQQVNERYLDAFATVDDSTLLSELITPLQQPRNWGNRRVRPLRPFAAEDYALFQALNRGEFNITGLRNRHLQQILYQQSDSQYKALTIQQRRRQSAAVGRKLRMLRAHGLIDKQPNRNCYCITEFGRRAITAVLTVQQTTISILNRAAA